VEKKILRGNYQISWKPRIIAENEEGKKEGE